MSLFKVMVVRLQQVWTLTILPVQTMAIAYNKGNYRLNCYIPILIMQVPVSTLSLPFKIVYKVFQSIAAKQYQ